jgi:NADPH:quinone reductase-like Zn-dependent oxidoreductase
MDPITSAAFPCAGVTSLVALVDKGNLIAGEQVLIRGAGGVGSTSVQVAKVLGAHVTVLASKASMDAAISHGADEVFDYRTTSPEELGLFDIIFDTVGGAGREAYSKNLTPEGKLLTIALTSLFSAVLSLRHGKHRTRLVVGFYTRKTLEHLAQLVNNGDIVPIIDSIYPMEQIVEAHRHADNRGISGKIIIAIPQS